MDQTAFVNAICMQVTAHVRLGLFLHSPFPSSEVFRTFPRREELLRSLLNADLIGAPSLHRCSCAVRAAQCLHAGMECGLRDCAACYVPDGTRQHGGARFTKTCATRHSNLWTMPALGKLPCSCLSYTACVSQNFTCAAQHRARRSLAAMNLTPTAACMLPAPQPA